MMDYFALLMNIYIFHNMEEVWESHVIQGSLVVVLETLYVGLAGSMLDLYLCNVYLRILPTNLSILSSYPNKIKIFASIIWISEFS